MNDPAALARIKHAARYGQILLSVHAEEEMANANVDARGVKNAILTATVALVQPNRFRLEGGVAHDGEGLVVVLREVRPGLFVITVF